MEEKIDTSYTIYLEDQPLGDGDVRVGQSYVHYNLEKDNSVLPAKALEGDQAIDKGIINSNQTINYKMRLWFSSDIPQSEENKVFKAKLNIVGNQNTKMMASGGFGLTNDEKATITKVVFQDSIKSIDNESKVWDVSAAKNKTVMARIVANTDASSTNTLYIQGKGGVTANSDSSNLFNGFSKLLEIENLKLLDTLTVTNMACMFMNCYVLENLDVSNFDTSNVINMTSLFQNCNLINSLNISNFDTSKVTNMSQMFGDCKNLITLDLSDFDTSQVTSMQGMFYGCTSLTTLDLNNFNTSKVTSMASMFDDCKSLINLDLRNATFDNVTSYNEMFKGTLSSVNIITKNATTKSWLEDKLGGKGTIVIA